MRICFNHQFHQLQPARQAIYLGSAELLSTVLHDTIEIERVRNTVRQRLAENSR